MSTILIPPCSPAEACAVLIREAEARHPGAKPCAGAPTIADGFRVDNLFGSTEFQLWYNDPEIDSTHLIIARVAA